LTRFTETHSVLMPVLAEEPEKKYCRHQKLHEDGVRRWKGWCLYILTF